MDRFANREAVRRAFEEVPVLDAVQVRRQDGAVRTGIGLCTLNRIMTTAHATSTGSGTPCGAVAVTGLLLRAGGRHRWPCCLVSAGGRRGFPRILAMAGAALDMAAAIRPPSLQGMAVAIPGISLRWAIWARREDKEGSAPSVRRAEGGSAIQDDGVQDGSRPHGRRVRSGKRAQARHGPASDVQDMLAWLRDCDRGGAIRKCGNSPPRGLQEVGDGRSEEGRGATGYAYAATSWGSAGR